MKSLLTWILERARKFRNREARRRLDQIVAQTAASYEIQDYRKRRAAALKNKPDRRARIAELVGDIR